MRRAAARSDQKVSRLRVCINAKKRTVLTCTVKLSGELRD